MAFDLRPQFTCGSKPVLDDNAFGPGKTARIIDDPVVELSRILSRLHCLDGMPVLVEWPDFVDNGFEKTPTLVVRQMGHIPTTILLDIPSVEFNGSAGLLCCLGPVRQCVQYPRDARGTIGMNEFTLKDSSFLIGIRHEHS